MCCHLTFHKLSHAERLPSLSNKNVAVNVTLQGISPYKINLNYQRTVLFRRDLDMFLGANVSVAVRLKAFFFVYSNDLVIVF